jgi:hypothetical protein
MLFATVGGCAIIFALVITTLVFIRPQNRENPTAACINNLKSIDGAVATWTLENSKPDGALPMWQDVRKYLVETPKCPSGGRYTLGAVGQSTCSVPGHTL